MGCNKNKKCKEQTVVEHVYIFKDTCSKNNECIEKDNCKKHDNCNKCCQNCCECCSHQDMREIYMYLGRHVYNLLKELQLPCNHPSLICSLQKLVDGGCLPCGHPSLDQLILMALVQDKPEKKCDDNYWCKYKK